LLDRLGQQSGLILVVAIAALLIALPVLVWRVRAAQPLWRAVWKTALEAGLLASLAGALALTLGAFATGGRGEVNFIPFQSVLDSFALGEFYVGIALYDLALNFILYFPLGLFAGLRFPRLSLWPWVVASFALATAVEATQGLVLARSADVTDVLMNGLGGTAGFLVARAIQGYASRLPSRSHEARR
jgi:glycopeptide antibiotics resistance protein